ncbi:MAG: lysylphosphatidylglycerol synthase domain-containing protein [Bacteroidota bacterium]|nr:lysylphosphatidylglycerol synthase domain-containing protein [Bacteroidota bacterium]
MKSKKAISFLLKISIVALALFFLYDQLKSNISFSQFDLNNIFLTLKNNFSVLVLVIFLMFLNWFVESLKWRFLISKIEKVSIKTSLRAVFSGITVSSFTPNRVGEYGGRVFCLKHADRIQGVLITVIGSMAQLIVTIVFGLVGILLLPNLMPSFDLFLKDLEFSYPIILFVVILLSTLLILLFLNASVFTVLLSKFRFLTKFSKYSKVFSFYSSSELLEVLVYSFVRYIIFTSQYFILLNIFSVEVSYINSMILITTMLFVVSVIPTVAIAEIGIRGSVALFLFGLLSNNSIGILSATFCLWIINLVLPALIGIIFIFTLRFFRK